METTSGAEIGRDELLALLPTSAERSFEDQEDYILMSNNEWYEFDDTLTLVPTAAFAHWVLSKIIEQGANINILLPVETTREELQFLISLDRLYFEITQKTKPDIPGVLPVGVLTYTVTDAVAAERARLIDRWTYLDYLATGRNVSFEFLDAYSRVIAGYKSKIHMFMGVYTMHERDVEVEVHEPLWNYKLYPSNLQLHVDVLCGEWDGTVPSEQTDAVRNLLAMFAETMIPTAFRFNDTLDGGLLL